MKRFIRWLYLALWEPELRAQAQQRAEILGRIGRTYLRPYGLACRGRRAEMRDLGMTRSEMEADARWRTLHARYMAAKTACRAMKALLMATVNAADAPDDVMVWWEREQARLDAMS